MRMHVLAHDKVACAGWVPVQLSVRPGDLHYLNLQATKDPAVLASFMRFCAAADALQQVLTEPPHTCKEWLTKVVQLLELLSPIKSPSMAPSRSYLMLWTFRSAALASMQDTKPPTCLYTTIPTPSAIQNLQASTPPILGLQGSEDVKVADFAKAVPDQNTWLEKCDAKWVMQWVSFDADNTPIRVFKGWVHTAGLHSRTSPWRSCASEWSTQAHRND